MTVSAPAGSAAPEFLAGHGLAHDAYEFAGAAHAGQVRKGDGSPYIGHPIAVARLLVAAGDADDELIAAALLHDVVEDTERSIEELDDRFGPGVAELVAAMTEDESIEPYVRCKDDHRDRVAAAGPRAATIYAADKLANLRDLRDLYAVEGEAAEAKLKAPLDVRVRIWREDAEMVARVAPELAILTALRAELDAFEADRAAAA